MQACVGHDTAASGGRESVREAIVHPLTMIASDGFDTDPPSHPRSAGTFTRTLARYVREEQALPLMEALRKMTLMPAQRLEARVPEMALRGRIAPGAFADIVVFDPEAVRDTATYEQPARYALGMRHVLVNGQRVVEEGALVPDAAPGLPVRAALR